MLMGTRSSAQIFEDKTPVVIINSKSVRLTKFAKIVAKFFKDVEITDTIVNSCGGLVGFRSFQRKILRHGFPKNKIFFTQNG